METKEIKIPVECYSRVVGYYRPVEQWNKGMQDNFANRKFADVDNLIAVAKTR